jgi:hypothetical protein
MRDGAVPFREVFSSQGPLFLPLLWFFDTIGLRTFTAARLGMVLVAVTFSVGVYVVARQTIGSTTTGRPFLAAVVVATSTAGIAAAGPLHSDGIALSCGVWALAVAFGAGPFDRTRPIVVGLLVGAGIAVKSVFLGPVGVALAWHYGRRRAWGDAVAAALTSVAAVLAASLPFGPAAVWDQSVAFQLDVPRDRDWSSNIADGVVLMGQRDVVFLVFAVSTIVAAAVGWRRHAQDRRLTDSATTVLVWLGAVALLLVFGVELNRGFYRFLAFLIAPAMVVFVALRPSRVVLRTALAVAVLLVPFQLRGVDSLLVVHDPSRVERELVSRLELLPDGAFVVSDEPGLAWLAGRHPPPDLVDTSWARIRAGYLTPGMLRNAIRAPNVCAVVLVSGRFAALDPTLVAGIAGYELRPALLPEMRLYERPDCPQ